MPRKAPPIDPDDLRRLYESGESAQRIAEHFQVSQNTVLRRLASLGIPRRSGVKDPGPDVLRRLYIEEQRNCSEIAGMFGAYNDTVTRSWLHKHGIPVRTGPESMRIRYSRMSADERRAIAKPAHDAVRGTKKTTEDLAKRAKSREARPSSVSAAEGLYANWLKERGIETIPQKSIGPYNADLGAYPIAVEVFGGNWHSSGRHALRHSDRVRYILDQGWHIIIVWCHALHSPLTVFAADYVSSFFEQARRNPSATRQYRVIRGTGELITLGCAKDDDFTFVPTYGATDKVRCGHKLPWQ